MGRNKSRAVENGQEDGTALEEAQRHGRAWNAARTPLSSSGVREGKTHKVRVWS